jgi:hypothetical protein
MTPEEKLDAIKLLVDEIYIEDFDFDVEHWENGNYDYSYAYGEECGLQWTIREIKDILEEKE